MLSLRNIKILAAVVFAAALVGSFLVLLFGDEMYGARRQLNLGIFNLQPSEFLKPSFAVLAAAVLADRGKLIVPAPVLTFALLLPALVILLLQPDVGQTGLLLCLWGAMLFFWGLPLLWVGAMAACAGGLGVTAYLFFPHVQNRVNQYLGHSETGYQAGLALKAFAQGGLTGVGPGAGTIKYRLPDAHSDFVFATAGEEFGLLLCGAIAALFCILTVRLLLRAAAAGSPRFIALVTTRGRSGMATSTFRPSVSSTWRRCRPPGMPRRLSTMIGRSACSGPPRRPISFRVSRIETRHGCITTMRCCACSIRSRLKGRPLNGTSPMMKL
jgi:cell division protein FtsW (lipid II flippase)